MKKILLPIAFLLLVLMSFVFAHDGADHTNEELRLPTGLQKQIEFQQNLALGITFIIALLAGILTFTSPCSFALLPIYISFLFKEKKKAMLATSSFVLGLTIAFSIFGLIAGAIGNYFNNYKLILASISGILLIAFGIMTALNKGFSFFTPKLSNQDKGIFNFVLLGFLFGVAWSPCIGPILSSIFILATTVGSTLKSTLLLITYAMGISIPLLIVAYFSDKTRISSFVERIKVLKFRFPGLNIITNWYNLIGGLLIILVGLIVLIYKGTSFIEGLVTILTGWTMNRFVNINYTLRESTLFSSSFGNFLGILLALTVLFIIAYNIVNGVRKSVKSNKEVKISRTKHK